MLSFRPPLAVALLCAVSLPAAAQTAPAMPGMAMTAPDAPPAAHDHAAMPGMDMTTAPPAHDHAAMDMACMDMAGAHAMSAAFGPYPHSREASGTAWQPDSSPVDGLHFSRGAWALMLHGELTGIYNNQGGPRGADKAYVAGNVMLMAHRPLGEGTTLSLRAMLSPEPLMGASGYPSLFATGETADGTTLLVDRQHPHDLFMELSASLSQQIGEDASLFVYAGLPGEPALGPPAFMHRVSGADNPLAPISHHWLDSTHISFGVVTAGATVGGVKIEASAFNGREPDQHRWDIEAPRLDSWAVRGTINPGRDLSLQVSYGYLKSPEALKPDESEKRITASATWNRTLRNGNLATTLACGRKMHGGEKLDAWLIESDWRFGANTLFARAENVDEAELFEPPSPLVGNYNVSQLTAGYIRDVRVTKSVKLGLGGAASVYAYPSALDTAYGSKTPVSFLVFARLKLG